MDLKRIKAIVLAAAVALPAASVYADYSEYDVTVEAEAFTGFRIGTADGISLNELADEYKLSDGSGEGSVTAIVVKPNTYADYIVNVTASGTYDIYLYASVRAKIGTNNDNRICPYIELNGEALYTPSSDGPKLKASAESVAYGPYVENHIQSVYLDEGENIITVGTDGSNQRYSNQDYHLDSIYLKCTEALTEPKLPEGAARAHGESFVSYAVNGETYTQALALAGEYLSASGTGSDVDGVKSVLAVPDSEIKFSLNAPRAGKYAFYIRSASVSDNEPFIYQNGRTAFLANGNVLTASGSETSFVNNESGYLLLHRGNNEITLKLDSGDGYYIDYIQAEFYDDSDPDELINTTDINGSNAYIPTAAFDPDDSEDITAEENYTYSEVSAASHAYYNIYSDGGYIYDVYISYYPESVTQETHLNLKIGSQTSEFTLKPGSGTVVQTDTVEFGIPNGRSRIELASDGDARLSRIFLMPQSADDGEPNWSWIEVDAFSASSFHLDNEFLINGVPWPDRAYDELEHVNNNTGTALRRGDWIEYTVNMEKGGNYSLGLSYVDGDRPTIPVYYIINHKQKIASNVVQTSNWSDYGHIDIGNIKLEEGENTIRIGIELSGANNCLFFNYLTLTDIDEFGVLGYRANKKELDNSLYVNRGCDNIVIYFSGAVDEQTVKDSSVYITDENGTRIPIEFQTEENTVTVKLKDSFDYETYYDINVTTDIKSLLDVTLKESSAAHFRTTPEGIDGGADTVTDVSAFAEYEKITVQGTVYSSVGVPIAGRNVKYTVNTPDGEPIEGGTASGVTDGNGKFSIDYTIGSGMPEGKYTVEVSEEYDRSKYAAEALYFTRATESSVIDEIAATKTADGVKDVLEKYQSTFDYNIVSVENQLSQSKPFYDHFTGVKFADAKDFYSSFDKFLAVELLRQADDAERVEYLLFNMSNNAAAAGLDPEKLALLDNQKRAFCDDVFTLADEDDANAYCEKLSRMADEYLIDEYGLEKPDFAAANVSVNSGQGITVDAGFDLTCTDVAGAEVTLVSTDGILSAASYKPNTGAEAKKSGQTVTFEYSPDQPASFKSPGSVTVTAPSETRSYKVKLSGSITYQLTEDKQAIYAPDDKEITLSVTAYSGGGGGGGGSAANGGSGRSSYGGGGGTGTSSGTRPVQTGTDEKFEFADMETSQWAKAAVEELLLAGIIAKSDDKRYRPEDNITREEFVKFMVLMADVYDASAQQGFTDTEASAWYSPYVASAVKAGLVMGRDDGSFGIGENIARQDMAVILYRFIKGYLADKGGNALFADDGYIADYAKEAVYSIRSAGIINGVGDNMFAPTDSATRAMAAQVIYKAREVMR